MIKHTRLVYVDFTRCLCMFSVMMYHYTTRYDELIGWDNAPVLIPAYVATVAVSVFLLYTGYFNGKNILDSNIKPLQYIKKRMVRLLPTYWVCVTLTEIILVISGRVGFNLKDYLLNMLLINRFFGVDSIDGAYWYLTIIIVYLVYSSVVLCIGCKYRDIINWIYIIVAFFIGVFNRFGIISFPQIVGFLLFEYLIKCIIGELLFKRERQKDKTALYLIQVLMLIVCNFLWCEIEMTICDIIAIPITYFSVSMKNKEKDNNSFLYFVITISNASYFIYLFHQQVGYSLIISLTPHISNANIIVLLVIITITIVGCLINNTVLEPMQSSLYKRICNGNYLIPDSKNV